LSESHSSNKSRLRVEDTRFLKGIAQYTDDYKPENLCYLGLVRSPYAHAKIKGIDFGEAQTNPNFIEALTAENLEGVTGPLFMATNQRPTGRMPLALNEVRFVGEPVVAFLSKEKYSLEDIADQILVEYQILPSVPTLEVSKSNKIKVFDHWTDNIAATFALRKGDPEQEIRTSSVSANVTLGIRRQAGAPLEPRGVVAWYDKTNDRYHVHSSVQSVHRLRTNLATELGLPTEKIHVMTMDVGGGFGTKASQSYPEAVLACVLSARTGLRVKWISTRTEDLIETAPGRDEYATVSLFCDSNGKIKALHARVEGDVGVFGSLNVAMNNTVKLMPGVYKIPSFDIKAACYATNKVMSGPVRGAGRPEACFLIERAVNVMARKLGIDPVEFRKRNLIQPTDIPYETGTGYKYDSGNFPLLLETLVQESKYNKLLEIKADKKIADPNRLFGVGMCLSIDDTGVHSIETAKIIISPYGKITVYTGSSPHGQGHETTLAEICAEELDLPLENVKISWGDTDKLSVGIGTYGSRSTAAGGSAIIEASRLLKSEILQAASKRLSADASTLRFVGGKVCDNNGKILMSLGDLLEGTNGIEVNSKFELKSYPFAAGAHLCALSIDMETGKLEIEKYVVVDDCGKIINSMIVDGQIHGAVAHGIGGAILEEIPYDDDAQPLATNFLTYLLPSATDVVDPEIFHLEFPSPLTLNGAKGVGETGTIGAYPAIFNALDDALSQVGASLNIAPATPEKVFEAMRSKS
jgi:carbon-monoxide dehydrogenase large subunit